MIEVSRDDVVSFRLRSHHLDQRLPAPAFLAAVGACGIQNTPPGSAALSLHARVSGLTPARLARWVSSEKSLLQAWSLRGAPYLFPTADAAVFTLGLLPPSEESLRFFIRGAGEILDALRMPVREMMERVSEAAREVLDGRSIRGKRALDTAIAGAVRAGLEPSRLATWDSPSPFAANQRVGEAVVSFGVRLVSLEGLICFSSRDNTGAIFARTDQWLEHELPAPDHQAERAELVRRYLHCYGPSTAAHFSEWAGIFPAQGLDWWRLVEPELIEVRAAGQPGWLLARDAKALSTRVVASGVRLLPPLDPWVQLRDREALVPDPAWRERIWRGAGWPGTVLVDGRLVGAWRGRKHGSTFRVEVDLLAAMSPAMRAAIEEEAGMVAPFRGCHTAEVHVL